MIGEPALPAYRKPAAGFLRLKRNVGPENEMKRSKHTSLMMALLLAGCGCASRSTIHHHSLKRDGTRQRDVLVEGWQDGQFRSGQEQMDQVFEEIKRELGQQPAAQVQSEGAPSD